jgi:hypothetical protein
MVQMNRLVSVLALSLFACTDVCAAEPDYFGTWKFVSAAVAPWADPAAAPDPAEKNALLGKTVAIKPKEISGPKTFACRTPKYRIVDYTADLLFQGAFGEMQSRDKSVDPLKLAASVGFSGASFKTLETGCEFDWHFANPTEIKIGLNDYVYTLKKQ